MPKIDCATFIHPDGRTEVACGGKIHRGGQGTRLVVHPGQTPQWLTSDVEVVAAHADGSVETAFVIGSVSTDANADVPGGVPIQYCWAASVGRGD